MLTTVHLVHPVSIAGSIVISHFLCLRDTVARFMFVSLSITPLQ